jgi:hypothetical protein
MAPVSTMTELALFASTFLLVMLLGLQSLNVNNGHHWAAFFTSFGIGASNLVLFKLAPEANTTEMAAYLLGGPLGILAAMWLHPRMARWIKRSDIKSWNRRHANTNCGADRL